MTLKAIEEMLSRIDSTNELVKIKDAVNERIKEEAAKVLKPYTDEVIYRLDVLDDIWNLTGDTSCSNSGPNGSLVCGYGPFKGQPFCSFELDRYLGRRIDHPVTGIGVLSEVSGKYCIAHSERCANPACRKTVVFYQVPGGGSKTCFRYAYYDKTFKDMIDLGESRICCKKCRKRT